MPADQAEFYKIIVDPLSESLRIPTKFTRRYGNNLPDTVSLKVPRSSKLWQVDLIRADDGEISLENGWREFRDHYSMQFGHLLFFQFDVQSSKFDVRILDMSATPIDYPLDQDDSAVISEKISQEQNGDRCKENTDQLGGSRIETSKTFNKQLQIGNAYRVLLPREFSEGTGMTADSEILLVMNGGNWPVHVNRTKEGYYEICAGFKKFLVENEMIIGSTMQFTLVTGTENTIEAQVVDWGTDKTKLFKYVKRIGGKDQCVVPLATQDRTRRTRTVSTSADHANDQGNECESHDFQDFLGGVSKSQKTNEKIVERRLTGRKRLKTGDRCNENTDQLGGSRIETSKTFNKQLLIGNAYRVLLPREFSEGTGITADSKVLLVMNGRNWPVHVNRTKERYYEICAGFKKFLVENEMIIGSTMQFTLITGTENTIEAQVVDWGTDKTKLFKYVKRICGKYQCVVPLATQDRTRRTRTISTSVDHANDQGNECESHDFQDFLGGVSKSQKTNEKIVERRLTGGKSPKTGDRCTVNTDQLGGSIKTTKQLMIGDAYRVLLPREFTEGTGLTEDMDILLDMNGMKWPVHVNFRKDGKYDICAGWNKFLKANKIVIGSRMEFTFVTVDNMIEARVVECGTDKNKLFNYIRRRDGKAEFIGSLATRDHANDEGNVCESHDSRVFRGKISESQKGKEKIVDHFTGRKRPKTGDLLENPSRKLARKVKLAVDDHMENVDTEDCFNDQGGGSSIGMKSMFTKQLTASDFYTLRLWKAFGEHTGIADTDVMLQDLNGKKWPFHVRYTKEGRYEIGAGWNAFLVSNKVTIGSKMSFTYIPSTDNTIKTRVVKWETGKDGDRHTENTDKEHCFHNQRGGSSIDMSWGFTKKLLSYNAYRRKYCFTYHSIKVRFVREKPYTDSSCHELSLISQVLPRDFADSTGITTDSEIMVRGLKGREWPVRIVCRKHGRYDIGGGWNEFLRKNDVIIGNTISCTLTSSSSNIIEVRVVKTGTDKGSANQ